MEICLSKHLTYCIGVKHAINKALKLVESTGGNEIYMLGDIVHNQYVVEMLCEKGIQTVYNIEDIPDEKVLIIRAHGTTPDVYRRAKEKNLHVVDATCNIVLQNQKIVVDMESKGFTIVLIGEKNHDEVLSITSFSKEPVIISNIGEVQAHKNRLKRICVIIQTTEILENVRDIISELLLYTHEMYFINTICRPSVAKQNEIVKMAKNYDVVYVVGSKKSKNTENLYSLARKFNPKAYFIENADMIRPEDLENAHSIAIAAGTSTPDFITNEVIDRLQKLSPNSTIKY